MLLSVQKGPKVVGKAATATAVRPKDGAEEVELEKTEESEEYAAFRN